MVNPNAPAEPSHAICSRRRKIAGTAFSRRDAPYKVASDKDLSDKDVSDKKDIDSVQKVRKASDARANMAAAPAQPAPVLRRAGEIAEISLEINLPAPEIDILDAAAFKIDPQATPRFRKTIFAYYLHRLARDAGELATVQRELAEWSAACKRRRNRDAATRTPGRRLSFKLTERTQRRLEAVLKKTGWSKTSLMRAVVMQAERDILENRSEKTILDLREIAEVVNA